MDAMDLRHTFIDGAGVKLHCAVAGEGAGRPLVVLLHGFPEFWYSWQHQIPALVAAGFHVMAPDLRGYNLSDKPAGTKSYHLKLLVEDIACLVRASGKDSAHVVGHDWGGIIAWTFAGCYPQLLKKLVILNAPHMGIYLRKVKVPPQLFRSWYVAFFCLPLLPELALSANHFASVRNILMAEPAAQHAFSDEDIARYTEALSTPGALTAALNYYRCGMLRRDARELARHARTDAETLILWGEQDHALTISLLEGIENYAPRACIQRFAHAGHWIQNEIPSDVNQAMVQFLQAATASAQ